MQNLPKGCDAALLFNGDSYSGPDANFLYHSGISADNTVLVWSKKGKTVVTSTLNARRCRRQSKHPVRVLAPGQRFSQLIPNLLPHRAKILGLDMDSISASRLLALKKAMPAKFVDISQQLQSMRAVKTPREISMIKKASHKSLQILNSLEFSASLSELDVVRQLALSCANEGVEFAYSPIVATAENSSLPHHTPTKKKLARIVLIDFGVKMGGYCSDLTRCFFLGRAKKEREKYEEAKLVFGKIVEGMHGCDTSGKLVAFSDAAAKSAGWQKMPHAIGHGVGLEVHESPRLYSGNREKLQHGMVMAIEPGWYGAKFGVRYENEVLYGKKCKVLL